MPKMKLLFVIFAFFVQWQAKINAQSTIQGSILSEEGEAVADASVYLIEINKGGVTTKDGFYSIKKIPNGSYTMVISMLGYKTEKVKINLEKEVKTLNITLIEEINSLNEVVVEADGSERLKQSTYKPSVLNIKNIQVKSTPIIDVLGQVSGIKVRQQGGLGSDANIMINGISGKGIRTFIDGIPVDLLGRGFELNNISSNLIKQIEVYKSVVPVHFGSDALGGIINITTQNQFNNYLDVSYTFGSWNTHQASIGFKQYLGETKKQFIQVDGFYNYSDNNYWMHDVDLVVDELLNTEKGSARRFHDGYNSALGRIQYGFQNVKWADDFRLIFSVSKIKNNWQHGINAIQPWGEAYSNNYDYNSILSWKKYSKNERWNYSALLGYNLKKEHFTDLSDKTYYWDGTAVPKTTVGESGYYIAGRTLKIDAENVFSRITINYRLNDSHKLNFTTLNSYEQIKGEDKAGAVTFGEDIYSVPQKLTKSFIGLSLESNLLNKKLTNVLSVKNYFAKSQVVNLKVDQTFDGYIENKNSILGYGDVMKYEISPRLTSYLGYEYAVRMPDQREIFGDGISIGPNPNLVPEKSQNLNIGLAYQSPSSSYNVEVNGFYRNTKNQIFLSVITFGLSSYLNLFQTETKGVEGVFNANITPDLSFFSNITWQDIALKNTDEYGKVDPRHIGSRIPNIPYLFANAGLAYTIKNVFLKDSRVELNYNSNYVNEFFLAWENDGTEDTKAKIQTQFIHNASIGYIFPNDKFSLNFECRNLADIDIYDNYKVQKPGRSFYLKLRMYIN